jgi:hypothetical protein
MQRWLFYILIRHDPINDKAGTFIPGEFAECTVK